MSTQLSLLFVPTAESVVSAVTTPMTPEVDTRLIALEQAEARFDTLIDAEMDEPGPNVPRAVCGMLEADRQSLIQAVDAVDSGFADQMSRALSEGSSQKVFDLIREAKEKIAKPDS